MLTGMYWSLFGERVMDVVGPRMKARRIEETRRTERLMKERRKKRSHRDADFPIWEAVG